MNWRIDYSKKADKFIQKQNIQNEVDEEIKKLFLKVQGKEISG